MKRNTAKRPGMQSFDPCGPILSMIANELRGNKSKGAKTRFFEDCIVARCGLKYPKLAARFQILREERANGE